jgi:hypothetical protein
MDKEMNKKLCDIYYYRGFVVWKKKHEERFVLFLRIKKNATRVSSHIPT